MDAWTQRVFCIFMFLFFLSASMPPLLKQNDPIFQWGPRCKPNKVFAAGRAEAMVAPTD